MTIYLFVLSSAVLYAASFLCLPFFWWALFFFLIPLFWALRFYRLSFLHGVMWGCVSYGSLLSAVWLVSIEYGAGWFRYSAPGLVVLWFALWSGLWFVLLTMACSYTGSKKALVQTSITTAYFMGIHTLVLWPFFGCAQGYPFVCPLIPLIYVSSPGLLPFIHTAGLLFILVGIQVLCVQKTKLALLGIGLFFLPDQRMAGCWKQEMLCTAERWSCPEPYERAQEICHHLIACKERHPEKRFIVLPESTFPFVLTEHLYAVKMWTDNALQTDTYLILGAYRREGGKLFNTFFITHQGRIIYYYDKTHLIPFFEQNHSNKLVFKKGNSLFLHKKESFSPGTSPQNTFMLTGSDLITPLICSETFWTMPSCAQAVALVNDSYFSLAYFPLTMRLLAHMNALEQRTDLLYCSLWGSTVYKNKLKFAS